MQAPPGDSHLQSCRLSDDHVAYGDWAGTALLGDGMDISLVQRSLENVLVLARTELILSIAGMGLCFGFVLEMVLIMQGCFSCC